MAVLVQAGPMTIESRIATTTLLTYRARHDRVEEVSLRSLVAGSLAGDVDGIRAIAAGDLKIAEIVLPEEVPCAAVTAAVWIMAGRGWDVVVLAPTHRLGEAHFDLRGTPCRLQSWWLDGAEISFGGYETP